MAPRWAHRQVIRRRGPTLNREKCIACISPLRSGGLPRLARHANSPPQRAHRQLGYTACSSTHGGRRSRRGEYHTLPSRLPKRFQQPARPRAPRERLVSLGGSLRRPGAATSVFAARSVMPSCLEPPGLCPTQRRRRRRRLLPSPDPPTPQLLRPLFKPFHHCRPRSRPRSPPSRMTPLPA